MHIRRSNAALKHEANDGMSRKCAKVVHDCVSCLCMFWRICCSLRHCVHISKQWQRQEAAGGYVRVRKWLILLPVPNIGQKCRPRLRKFPAQLSILGFSCPQCIQCEVLPNCVMKMVWMRRLSKSSF